MRSYTTYESNAKLKYLPFFVRTYCSEFEQKETHYPSGIYLNHLIYTVRGKGYAEIDGMKKELNAGEFFFYRACTPVHYYAAENHEFVTKWITFDGYGCMPLFDYYNVPSHLFFSSEKVASRLSELCTYADHGGRIEHISARLYTLLTDIFSKITDSCVPSSFERAVLYIRTNYYKDLSVSAIASYAGISESALYKQFRNVLKTTPVTFINLQRIDWAKYFLVNNPKMTIDEISKRVGFHSSSYFSECFRQAEAISPAGFRKAEHN